MKSRKVSISDDTPTKPLDSASVEDEDIFEAELLPSYAKTYILPRKMRRSSTSEAGEEEGGGGGGRSRKGSFARKQSMVTPEFQMSMLRASLEEKNIISVPEEEEEEEDGPRPEAVARRRWKSLVPCVAAGRMREYTEFVKEGNFSPMTVLDPDLGMDSEIFAKVRSSSVASTRGTSGRESGLGMNNLQPEDAVNLDEALSKVTAALERVESDTVARRESESSIVPPSVQERRRWRGRRARKGPDCDGPPASALSDTASSGYHSQGEANTPDTTLCDGVILATPDPEDFEETNLLDALIEEKHRFTSSFCCGEATLDLFLDKKNPCNKVVHPALPKVIEEKMAENKKRGESNWTEQSLKSEVCTNCQDIFLIYCFYRRRKKTKR